MIIYFEINLPNFLEDFMKVTPLADRVLVKTEKTESKTASGIIIPDTAQEKTQIATVIAVGDDKEKIKVKAGDRVMYDKYAGTSIKIDGEDHLILKAADTSFSLFFSIITEPCDYLDLVLRYNSN